MRVVGCSDIEVGNMSYFGGNSGVWLSPSHGVNGVYCRVVPAPDFHNGRESTDL